MGAMGTRSVTNSTTNLTTAPPKLPNAFEGIEHSLFTFKIMLLALVAIDLFFLGLFIPGPNTSSFLPSYVGQNSQHTNLLSFKFIAIYGYLFLLLIATMGIFMNAPRFLAPIKFLWCFTFLMTLFVLAYSSWEYLFCSWNIYFKPESDIRKVCSWTFIESYIDAAIYFMILGLKVSQIFMAQIVIHLLYKAIRIQSFDARKHTVESDDEDVMVVFERMPGGSSTGKVRDATIA